MEMRISQKCRRHVTVERTSATQAMSAPSTTASMQCMRHVAMQGLHPLLRLQSHPWTACAPVHSGGIHFLKPVQLNRHLCLILSSPALL